MHKWSLHEAKNKLSNLIEIAKEGDPQIITKRGKEVVAIISYEDYKNNICSNKSAFKQFLAVSGPKFDDIDIERLTIPIRETDI